MIPNSTTGMTHREIVEFWEYLQVVLTPDDKTMYADLLKKIDKYHKLLRDTLAATDQLERGKPDLATKHANFQYISEIARGDPNLLLQGFIALTNKYAKQSSDSMREFLLGNVPELDLQGYKIQELPSQVVAPPPPPMDDERASFGPSQPRKHEKYDYHEDKNGQGKLKFAKKYLKGQGLPHSRKECEKLCSVMDAEGVVFE